MSVDFSNFARKDKLGHLLAIKAQKEALKFNFEHRNNKSKALELENALNKFYYGDGTQKHKSIYTRLQDPNDTQAQKIMAVAQKVLNEKFKKSPTTTTINAYNFSLSDNMVYQKSIKSWSTVRRIQKEAEAMYAIRKNFDEKLEQRIENLYNEINTLASQGVKTVTRKLNDNFINEYNKVVSEIYEKDFTTRIGVVGEEMVAILNTWVETEGKGDLDDLVKTTMDNMIGDRGSNPTMSIQGLSQENIDSLTKNNEWRKSVDPFGSQIVMYKSPTNDKVDVKLTLNNNPYYISVKNYSDGANGDIHFVSNTRLASLLSSKAVVLDFSKAFLRYAGWWWNWRDGKDFYHEQEIVDMAKKTILVVAISAVGLGQGNGVVDVLTIHRRSGKNPGFKCYSVQDIINTITQNSFGSGNDGKNVNDRIEIDNFPAKSEYMRPKGSRNQSHVRQAFIDAVVSVKVKNLKQYLLGNAIR